MFKLFYKKGEQRQWVILLTTIFPLLLTIWGIVLSVKSYNLSVATGNNREQIDSIKVIIGELRQQNTLLITQVNQLAQLVSLNEKVSSTQDMQLDVMKTGAKASNKPQLQAEPREMGPDYLVIDLLNKGGDILKFKIDSKDHTIIDIGLLATIPTITKGNYYPIRFSNLKRRIHRIKVSLQDNLGNKYYQEMILSKDINDNFDIQFGALMEIK